MELVCCNACLYRSGYNAVSVSSTLGCHIHQGFSGSDGGGRHGCEGCGNDGCGCLTSRTKTLKGGTGFVGFFGCTIDFLTELVGCFTCIFHTLAGVFDGIVIAFQLTFHTVEGGFCIVKLYLPRLGTLIVFTKGVGSVFEGGTENLYFLLLGINLPAKHLVSGGESFDRLIVLVEL